MISVLTLLGTLPALADSQAMDLGTVSATGGGGDSSTPSVTGKGTATYEAPGSMSINATEPVFNINQHYIEENAAPGANYSDIISILPSVTSVDPNGPGGMENQALTLRGFQDGQYNVTFDGIPWGDSNDFTHHTTSYFMEQDLAGVKVDLGPGDASNIGYSTFGGTIALSSKLPQNQTGTSIFGIKWSPIFGQ
ncbi:TonB-dependent receptor plug domain-containing protein [Ferrovum sp.]|uniref:TonB-dependent receptor plug domain-containing protein n=1 Tax=Ferrovum sp. TaxID=2609467 RepID=UPI0026333CC5|nr:TonB-dependent receptor plug domain-containing protein [Ferrovum sp.]